ncbi:membrane protein [Halogranum amylolyticum]|uniref:Membrane protein n=1 Tax=Halogranum amylolyticum TaxID=660520 RepID=A0A1H8NCH5_9EURY|nr:YhjD/YihY/BrkB family envelope integrity protein [Halogranum amylolyticum]SEO27123.1 membrane protein [Halogranum amylolyticum]
MNPRIERGLTVGRAIVTEIRAEKITFLAGSIAYHAFVSLLPLLFLLLAAISATGSRSLEEGFITLIEAVLTPGAQQLLVTELQTAGGSTGVTIVGGLVLVWGTLRIFRGLDTAFSDIYETETANTFGDQLSDGLIVLVTFAVAIVTAVVVRSVVPLGDDGLLAWTLSRAVLVAGLAVTFFPMYYIFPDTNVGVVEVFPGTLFAAVGLVTFETLFTLYAQSGDKSVVGGILVLLTWLYFSGLVVLLGAVVNAVLSNRSADVSIEPVVGGVRPAHDRERPTRHEVADSLTELKRLFDTDEDVVVSVGDQSVTLPPPQRYETDTESSRLGLVDGTVRLELRWSTRDTADVDRAAASDPVE